MKKNMSDFMKYKEKEECYDAVNTVAMKVNHHDADMMRCCWNKPWKLY